MRYLIYFSIAAVASIMAVAGCSSVTHINYYGVHPDSVVHDTVYVYVEEHQAPDAELGDPDSGLQPEPSGRVVTVLQLDPGTATVVETIDYDHGMLRYRMQDNVLESQGLRFELNCMSEYIEDALEDQYWLVAVFDSERDWSEQVSGPQPISDPSITLSVNGEETRYYSTGFSVESSQPLAIGSFQTTLLIPVEPQFIREIGDGTRVSILIRDRGTRQFGELSLDARVNFNTFAEDYIF